MSDEAAPAANRLIGRRVLLELWGQGKLEIADELYAPNYVDHVVRGPESGQVRGPEGIKQAVTLFRSAFPNLTYFVHEEIAEGDLVMTRFSARGTQKGPPWVSPRRGVSSPIRAWTLTGSQRA